MIALLCATGAHTSYAHGVNAAPVSAAQHEGVQIDATGRLSLLDDAASPPPAALLDEESGASFRRYGFFISAPQPLARPARRFSLSFAPQTPPSTALRVDLRVGGDEGRWSAWEVGLDSGAAVSFPWAGSRIQYRVTLLGNRSSPTLTAIQVHPLAGPAEYQAMQEPVAPTFRVRATRMGMVGGRTANGHIIRPRDHYVSLPSWRSLSSRGGHEYQVRITYRGRSSVAPVWDVGPWNTRDNYWDVQRERYRDLRHGWPQDHAAYYEGYNGGRAEKGRVRFPTAVDVGDGVWWDDLGIRGDQAEIEVTFLWLGRDPQGEQPAAQPQPQPQPAPAPAPPPAPADPNTVVVDERDPGFHERAEITWYQGPNGCGEHGRTYWTYSTPEQANSENTARWQPNLPAERLYDVYVHVPICPNRSRPTASAYYSIRHRDGLHEVVVNQGTQTAWVHLGRFPFTAGEHGYVELDDITNDSMQVIWYDAVKWVVAPDQ
jgi:hypothetical protein